MDIKSCKRCIEDKVKITDFLIFKEAKSDFISRQYIQAIASINNQTIEYIDSIDPLINELDSIFIDSSYETEPRLKVLKTSMFEYSDIRALNLDSVFIVCNKVSEETENLFKNNIIDVPALEAWQIKDYVYSIAEGADTKQLDRIIQICGSNIERLDSELAKLQVFAPGERKYLLDGMIRDGAFNDLTDYTVFNVTSALLKKDISTLNTYMKHLSSIDINEVGLITILSKNVKDLINVQLTPNPTPESTGLDSRKLYAIKKMPRTFSAEKLSDLYKFLCDLDRRLKNGELPVEIMINYIILKVLTM